MKPASPVKLGGVQSDFRSAAVARVRVCEITSAPMVLSHPLPRFAFICLMLSACAELPLPSLPSQLPAAWHGASTAPAQMPAPDLQGWWKAFEDPGLDALVERALAQNLQVAQARSRLRQARLLAGRERTQFLPTLNAGVRTVQDAAAVDSYLRAGLDASWELGLFGAREAAERGGKARLDQAAAGEQAARVSVVAEVVRQHLMLQAARFDEALRLQMLALDERALALHALRQGARLGTLDERRATELRLLQARAQLTQPRLAAAQARQALAVLLADFAADEPSDPVAAAPAPPPQLAPFRLPQVPADLLRFRPDIHAAEADVTQASSDLGQARAEQYPRVVLGTSFIYSYNITQNHRIRQSNSLSIGPLVDIPLFDWGRRRATTDARQEALEASLLAYRQALVAAVGETESALSALAQAFERATQLDAMHQFARRQLALQGQRVRLGLASELERLGAEHAELQARVELAEAQWACAQAVVVVYKALGGAPLPANTPAPAAEIVGLAP